MRVTHCHSNLTITGNFANLGNRFIGYRTHGTCAVNNTASTKLYPTVMTSEARQPSIASTPIVLNIIEILYSRLQNRNGKLFRQYLSSSFISLPLTLAFLV